jgi:tellurium resistance protein TerD
VLYYYGEDGDFFLVECSSCGRILKYHKQYLSSADDNGCVSTVPLSCKCGYVSPGTTFTKKPEEVNIPYRSTPKAAPSDNSVKCPRCGSTQISSGNKGFGLGKAAAGGLLLGPVGLLGGLVGSKKIMVTCLKCGHKWEAGKR